MRDRKATPTNLGRTEPKPASIELNLVASGQITGPCDIIDDVTLSSGGVLRGRAIDSYGKPMAGAMIAARLHANLIAAAKSDAFGRFTIRGLKPGTYLLLVGSGGSLFRMWDADAAPAHAQSIATLMAGHTLALGQTAVAERSPPLPSFSTDLRRA